MKDLANTVLLKRNENLKNQISKLDIFETLSLDVCLDAFSEPDFKVIEKERIQPFETFLEPIQKFKSKPCVYFIEIVEGNTEKIRTSYEKLKLTNKAALRKEDKKIFDTTCLYVGKSQKSIIHRLKVHFGYKNTTESGLQLLHWAKPLDLKLTLHVYCFPTELDFLLPMYEKELNRSLKPLIGHL
jgi:hypothetical protein